MTPVFRNIYISNLTATCQKSAGVITGLPESKISNVVFENVRISSVTGLTIKNADGVQFKNVQITTEQGPPVITKMRKLKAWPRRSKDGHPLKVPNFQGRLQNVAAD